MPIEDPPKKIRISASKLDTFESCSWRYYCKYVLKLPETSNDGARRGTVVHTVLECLLNPRHKKHYDLIIKEDSPAISPSIDRLIIKKCKEVGLENLHDHLDLIYSHIMVALKYEFFGENPDIIDNIQSEWEFDLDLDEKTSINGKIDKTITYKDNKKSVKDYKTSKLKFDSEKREHNVQALMYALAIYKRDGVIPEVEFLFLRFVKKPSLKMVTPTKEHLLGFEEYLLYVGERMANFNNVAAVENMAFADEKRKWLCGKEVGFICPFRKPAFFFRHKNEKGDIIKTTFTRQEIVLDKGEKVVKLDYKGCPAFN